MQPPDQRHDGGSVRLRVLQRQLGRVWVIGVLAGLVSISVLGIMVVRFRADTRTISEAETAQVVARLSNVAAHSIFALQDERTLGELWRTTRTSEARDRYSTALSVTDQALDMLAETWQGEQGRIDQDLTPSFDDVINAVGTLPDLRKATAQESTYRAYTSVIQVALSATTSLDRLVTRPSLSPDLRAYLNLLRADEALTQERGIITTKIGEREPVNQDEALELSVLERDARTNLAAAQALVGEDSRERILGLLFGETSARIQELLAAVIDSETADYGLDASTWFDISSARIRGVREVADQINANLTSAARATEASAHRARLRSAAGLGALWLLSLGVGLGAVVASRDRARALADHTMLTEGLLEWFLPETFPEVDGLEVAARYAPASEYTRAGGDWYDLYEVSDGLVAVTIGDVVGHGPAASAHMAQLRNLLRGLTLADPASPSKQIQLLDHATQGSDIMATVLHGLLDLDRGNIVYCRAGHVPGLMRQSHQSVTRLEAGSGPPIGAGPDSRYSEAHIPLQPGTLLALFTDGLIEVRGRDLETGFQKATSVLQDSLSSLDELADMLMAARPDRHDDDAALLLVRWSPTSA